MQITFGPFKKINIGSGYLQLNYLSYIELKYIIANRSSAIIARSHNPAKIVRNFRTGHHDRMYQEVARETVRPAL